ncbi:hypothetical protein K2173_000743 [Erythroxylum novogranatense]|uniref:Uncharacterized protein n=1 Tax=Erythroxylum novogranatense TaxID=1862640 RepID=A0AAV8T406_9ROSI|nr:hypothetical protein K2173_000743 [Erythroxylum novogranatense]
MAERKLNFNVPLLSVRRYSTPTKSTDEAKGKKIDNPLQNRRYTIPSYKCELNLDQVTEPVAVPFQWEHIPGRPKDGSALESEVLEEASASQRVLPGKHSGSKCEDQTEFRSRTETHSFCDKVPEWDCSKEGVNQNAGLESVDKGCSDDDDVYSDALDTISSTDSFSMKCSATDLSGCDGLNVKTTGTFSTDPQTRDFMMSRFLPAAKAMALETPHYASKKQSVAIVQSEAIVKPRQVSKLVSVPKPPQANQKESAIIPYHSQDVEEEEEEGCEDDYDDYSTSGNIATKGCGLLPRLCFKNSLSILNPIPGLKVRSHVQSAIKPNKAASTKSNSQNSKKHSGHAVYKQKTGSGSQSPRLPTVENKPSFGSNRFSHASDQQTIGRTSPFRRSGAISPFRNQTPQSPFRGKGFPGTTREAENFKANKMNLYCKNSSKSQELYSHYGTRGGSRPLSPTIEKTVYVDTVNKMCSKSGPLGMSGYSDSVGRYYKSMSKSREMGKPVPADSCFQVAKHLNVLKGNAKLEDKIVGCYDAKHSCDSPISQLRDIMDELCQEAKAVVCVNETGDGSPIDKEHIQKQGNVKNSLSPVAPTLPKTPSESWLWRTLPSISSQNSFSHSYRGTGFQSKWRDSKTPPSTNTKWETIVKSSYSAS